MIGILILNSKYKYGSKKTKEIFLFKPLDKTKPNYLVASDVKKKLVRARQLIVNQYALITELKIEQSAEQSTEQDKYYGCIQRILGPVNDKEIQYEAYLHHYDLYTKTQRIRNVELPSSTSVHAKAGAHHHRDITKLYTYSIDPKGCRDVDDAISFENNQIGIHIADVSYVLEKLGYNPPKKDTSVYLPHRQLNMLPEKLSCDLCSLLPGKERYAFTTWISYNGDKLEYEFEKTLIKSNRAYSYDEADKYINTKLNPLFKFVRFINKNYLKHDREIMDTHHLVETLMILTNHLVAKHLYENKITDTVYRVHQKSERVTEQAGTHELSKFLNILQSKAAMYVRPNKQLMGVDGAQYFHYGLGIKYYTHFTSPIRRYVDIYVHNLLNNLINGEDTVLSIDLDHINDVNNRTKKLDRKCNKIKFIHLILAQQSSNSSVNSINYKVNLLSFDEKYLTFYIPKYKLTYRHKICDRRVTEQYTITKTANTIAVNDVTYELYQEMSIHVNAIHDKVTGEPKLVAKILVDV
jgi:exoribonuclease R